MKGKGSGLAIIVLLSVALLVAFLALKNISTLKSASAPGVEQSGDPMQQAQDLVNQINDRMQQAGQTP